MSHDDKLLTAADLPFLRASRELAPFLRELPAEPENEERARCPDCGIPTVPDHDALTFEARLCDTCYLERSREDII